MTRYPPAHIQRAEAEGVSPERLRAGYVWVGSQWVSNEAFKRWQKSKRDYQRNRRTDPAQRQCERAANRAANMTPEQLDRKRKRQREWIREKRRGT